MNQNSKLIGLMPQVNWFVIEHADVKEQFKLKIGDKIPKQLNLINTVRKQEWAFEVRSVNFDKT